MLPWFSFSHLRSLCCRQSETGIRPRTSGFIFSSEKFEKKVCTADAGSQLGPMGQTNTFYCTSHTSLVKLGTTTPPVCVSTKKYKKEKICTIADTFIFDIADIFIFDMQVIKSHKFNFTRQEESTHELSLEIYPSYEVDLLNDWAISLFVLKWWFCSIFLCEGCLFWLNYRLWSSKDSGD